MQGVSLTNEEVRKLLSCGCSDAVALYLYRKAELPLETALDSLHFSVPQMVSATDCLKQLGLWDTNPKQTVAPEKPVYNDEALRHALRDQRGEFSKLVGEAQRRLGRTLSTEELKTLLSFTDYLRLPTEVIGILLSYCVERNRRRGVRPPSMRTMEREAYRWADEGIDNLEAACFYVQTQLTIHDRIQQLRLMMQLDQRRLTAPEEQYLASWIGMGFPDASIKLAYERTCLNTGGLRWAYMNSILKSWNEKKLYSPEEISKGDSLPPKAPAKAPDGIQRHNDQLSPLARRAVQQALAEETERKNGI